MSLFVVLALALTRVLGGRVCIRTDFVGFFFADFVGFVLTQFGCFDFFPGGLAFAFLRFRFFVFEFAFERFFEGERVHRGRQRRWSTVRGGGEKERGDEEQNGEQRETTGHGRVHRLAEPQPLATQLTSTPSIRSSASFIGSPPPYPPMPPPLRRTRWQGTTIGSGLEPQAVPAARTARSLPALRAISV